MQSLIHVTNSVLVGLNAVKYVRPRKTSGLLFHFVQSESIKLNDWFGRRHMSLTFGHTHCMRRLHIRCSFTRITRHSFALFFLVGPVSFHIQIPGLWHHVVTCHLHFNTIAGLQFWFDMAHTKHPTAVHMTPVIRNSQRISTRPTKTK